MEPLLEILKSIGRPRLLVLGDLILDRYTWGNAERVSPEAPVLVLAADAQEARLGGASSVASLLRGLDAEVALAGVIGDDTDGQTVGRLLEEVGIDQGLVLADPARPTTTKERFIGRAASRHPHQILRVDHELCDTIPSVLEERLARSIIARLNEFQAVLVSDYKKGVCTPGLLRVTILAAKDLGLPVLIDPARITDYERYQGATLLVPNRAEAALATGQPKIGTPEDALAAARHLRKRFDTRAVIVKLDSDGMAVVSAEGGEVHIPTRPRDVHDVTGAGDMVLAVLGLTQASGIGLADAVRLANAAAGLEVQRLGVAPVTRGEIQSELAPRTSTVKSKPPATKFVSLDELEIMAESYRQERRSVVMTNGCFDLLHVGHATYLEEAARLGDVLVVAVNSDRSVRRLKGPSRPVIPQEDRARLLAALECVDHVLVFDEATPHELLRRIRPDVLVKGGTYTKEEVVGREVVASYGGRVCVTDAVPSVSTTKILAAIGQPHVSAEFRETEEFSCED
jgi:D-beta-D-heptose 7-phosphate kinase / D-beta-D-heptose 1-phosphate adenosyltransferase